MPFSNKTPKERFWEKVNKQGHNGCWIWTAHLDPFGYGVFLYEGKRVRAHRLAYEFLVAPIPEGYDIIHVCKVRECVNALDTNHLLAQPSKTRRGWRVRKDE